VYFLQGQEVNVIRTVKNVGDAVDGVSDGNTSSHLGIVLNIIDPVVAESESEYGA
jgi:hypothetical protein